MNFDIGSIVGRTIKRICINDDDGTIYIYFESMELNDGDSLFPFAVAISNNYGDIRISELGVARTKELFIDPYKD